MEITNDMWSALGFAVVIILIGLGRWINGFLTKPQPPQNSVITGVGLGLQEREEINQLTRIAEATERIADCFEIFINKERQQDRAQIRELLEILKRERK